MLVLFDIDDTLLDNRSAQRAAATALHQQLTLAEPLDLFHERWLQALQRHYDRYLLGELSLQEQRRARLREVLREELADSDADELYTHYSAAYQRSWALFDDALPCLDALRGHRLGIISNGDSSEQRAKLRRAGILERFAVIVTSDQAPAAKPDPRIFASACALLDVRPGDALYVGDRRDIDAEGALGAGLQAVWLDRLGLRAAAELPFPTIDSLASLPSLIHR